MISLELAKLLKAKKEAEKIFQKEYFKKLNDKLKNDRNFVMAYLYETKVSILPFLNDELRSDMEIIKECLNYETSDFQYIPEVLKNDKTFLLKSGLALQNVIPYMDKKLWQNDRELSKYAIRADSKNFTNLDETLKNDKMFIIELLEECGGLFFDYVDPKLKDDKEFIIQLISKHNGASVTQYISERLKNDLNIAMLVANNDNFKYLGDKIRSNKEVMLFLLKNLEGKLSEVLITEAPYSLRNDKEFMITALYRTYDYINICNSMGDDLKKDRDVLIAAIKILFYLRPDLIYDLPEFMSEWRYSLGYFFELDDINKVIVRVKEELECELENQKNNKEFIIDLMSRFSEVDFKILGDDLKKDGEMLRIAINYVLRCRVDGGEENIMKVFSDWFSLDEIKQIIAEEKAKLKNNETVDLKKTLELYPHNEEIKKFVDAFNNDLSPNIEETSNGMNI